MKEVNSNMLAILLAMATISRSDCFSVKLPAFQLGTATQSIAKIPYPTNDARGHHHHMNDMPASNARYAHFGNLPLFMSSSTTSEDESSSSPKSILDMTLNPDPEVQKIRVPFVHPLGNDFIDCKLHFSVELQGVQYTIATPHDHSVAICRTDNNGMNTFMRPEDDIEELFKIASLQIVEDYDGKLSLKNTPQTLTIEGDLEQFIEEQRAAEKKNDEVDKDSLLNEILDTDEDDERWFDEEMKSVLGDNYEEDDDDDDDEIDDSFFKLIQDVIPEEKDIETLMTEIFLDTKDGILGDVDGEDATAKPIAERLLSFDIEGTLYSLVKMTQPTVIVGRDDPAFETRRLLLTPEESAMVIPELEKQCKEEFSKIGLLPSSQ